MHMRFVNVPRNCTRCKGLHIKHLDELERPQGTCINCGRDAINYAPTHAEAAMLEVAELSVASIINTRYRHRKLRERAV